MLVLVVGGVAVMPVMGTVVRVALDVPASGLAPLLAALTTIQSHHLGADSPQSLSSFIISCSWCSKPLDLAVDKILPTHSLHLLRHSAVNGGLGSLLRVLE